MFLIDYAKAINYLMEVLDKKAFSFCVKNVANNVYGSAFIFSIEGNSCMLRVSRNGCVERIWPDTWRNPDHKETVCEGGDTTIW